MENVIDLTNQDKLFLSENNEDNNEQTSENEQTETLISQTEENTHEHSAAPTKGSARAIMTVTAIFGAAAGVILALNGKADAAAVSAVMERITGDFLNIFVSRMIFGAIMLTAEFLLGFFAFGDFISWVVPVVSGMGAGFFLGVVKNPVFLPSEIVTLIAVILLGANSALFSRRLLGLAAGNRAFSRGMTVFEYLGRFFLALIAVTVAAVYEGIAVVNFVN